YGPNPDAPFKAKYFTSTLNQETDISIDVDTTVNTYLYLLQGTGEFAIPYQEFDEQQVNTTLAAGNYTIEVTTNSRYAPGQFTISLHSITNNNPCTQTLMFDQVTEGVWSSNCEILSWDEGNSDPYTGSNPERANYYSFTLNEATDIRFARVSSTSNLIMTLYHYNDFDQVIATTAPSSTWNDPSSQMSIRLDAGSYTLEVTRFNQLAIGQYSIQASIYTSSHCDSTITFGTTVQGLLAEGCDSIFRQGSNNDPYGPQAGNYYAKRFEFTLTQAQAVQATLSMPGTYAYLYLAKKEGSETVLFDESAHDYWNSTYYPYVRRTLDAGTYILEVSSEYPMREDNFSINLRTSYVTPCDSYLALNTVIQRELLASTNCTSEFKERVYNNDPYGPNSGYQYHYAQAYTFKIEQAGQYELVSTSNEFEAHLFLLEGTNRRGLVLTDQEQMVDTENRLFQWLSPGYYTVEVTTNTWSERGQFSLYLSDGETALINEQCDTRIDTDSAFNVTQRWSNQCYSDTINDSYANYFVFTTDKNTRLSLELNSSLASSVYLAQANNNQWTVIAADDGSHVIHYELAPGTYRIEAAVMYAQYWGYFTVSANFEFDSDGDTVFDDEDIFPEDASETHDADNDGIGDNADTDDDNDGVFDVYDAFAFDSTESLDSDGDGIGDNQDSSPYPAAGVFEINAAEFFVDENGTQLSIDIVRSHVEAGAGEASVFYFTQDIAAVANVDFLPALGELIFAENETVKTANIVITDDDLYEANETFRFSLGQTSQTAMLGELTSARVTIVEDDAIPPQGAIRWALSETHIDETAASVSLTIERLGDAQGELSVDYVTLDASAVAGMDFVAQAGTVLFADQQTSSTITLQLVDDQIYEGTESFTVRLSNPSNEVAIVSENTTSITITDDIASVGQAVIHFTENAVTLKETQGLVSFTLARVNGSSATSSLAWTTLSDTAIAGEDFQQTEGIVEFQEGETQKTIEIMLLDDTVYEGNEGFFIQLNNPVGATVPQAQKQLAVTLTENQTAPAGGVFNLSGITQQQHETDTIFIVTINRLQASNGVASVEYSTLSKSAMAGEDFEQTSGSLTFEDAETSKTVEISVLDDQHYEGPESFFFQLNNVQGNAVIGQRQQVIFNIVDDEPATGTLQFSGANYQVNEGEATVLITVIRQHGTQGQVSTDYSTEDSSALASEHYTETFGTVIFSEGETTKTIEVPINNDEQFDGDRSLFIQLSSPVNVVLGEINEAEITIQEDDASQADGSSGGGGGGSMGALFFIAFIFVLALHRKIKKPVHNID
ncbi:MAG: hypothetical protein JKY66_04880, partial [Spongiibacteraceae bacterium]|nr:hypothetical protein [Spongiibacteraceae bacterium]